MYSFITKWCVVVLIVTFILLENLVKVDGGYVVTGSCGHVAEQGDTCVMRCHPDYMLSRHVWLQNGVTLTIVDAADCTNSYWKPKMPKYSTSCSSTHFDLIIKNVQYPRDNVTWQCNCEKSPIKLSQPFPLRVTVGPKGTLVASPSKTKEGDTVKFTCNSGPTLPAVTKAYLRVGKVYKQMDKISSKPNKEVTTTIFSASAKISPLIYSNDLPAECTMLHIGRTVVAATTIVDVTFTRPGYPPRTGEIGAGGADVRLDFPLLLLMVLLPNIFNIFNHNCI